MLGDGARTRTVSNLTAKGDSLPRRDLVRVIFEELASGSIIGSMSRVEVREADTLFLFST